MPENQADRLRRRREQIDIRIRELQRRIARLTGGPTVTGSTQAQAARAARLAELARERAVVAARRAAESRVRAAEAHERAALEHDILVGTSTGVAHEAQARLHREQADADRDAAANATAGAFEPPPR
jgi:hypothetical protein